MRGVETGWAHGVGGKCGWGWIDGGYIAGASCLNITISGCFLGSFVGCGEDGIATMSDLFDVSFFPVAPARMA